MKKYGIILLAAVLLLGGCTSVGSAQAPTAETASITIVPETGLLSYHELPEDTFTVEIMPDADNHIYEIILDYYGGADKTYLGQLVFEPETDSYFSREDTFRRGFTASERDLMDNFTLVFRFKDADGTEMAAQNEYTVDAEYGINYFLKIVGSKDEGYQILDVEDLAA